MGNTPFIEVGARYPLQEKHEFYAACGVYALWIQDAVYVGESSFVPHRWDNHVSALRSGTHPYEEIQNAYDNKETIEVSLLAHSSKVAKKRRMQEVLWIQKMAKGVARELERLEVILRERGLYEKWMGPKRRKAAVGLGELLGLGGRDG